jgi:5'(3')-deoxyribonucleotidase
MKKLVIAIDCDDVLINASEYIVMTYNQLYGTNVQLETAHSSASPAWQADRTEVFRRLHDIQQGGGFAVIPPRSDAIESIKRLAAHHDLHLVTARDAVIMGVTEGMVAAHFGGCFNGIHHVGPDNSKGAVCELIGAQALVDDNSKHLFDALEHGVELAIWFGDYPWQTSQEFDEHIERAGDWIAAERMINDFAG